MPADARRGVLVVDDDERFAVTLAAALARRGYVAHVAHDAAAALATARTKEPDAAVVDLKLGADDYLAKPVTASAVVAVLERGARKEPSPDALTPLEPMSPRRLEWEHIQRVLAEHDGNISATARTLRMHRRTLQRKLSKRPSQS